LDSPVLEGTAGRSSQNNKPAGFEADGARVEAEELSQSQRPLARLAKDEEPGVRSGEARRRGRLEL